MCFWFEFWHVIVFCRFHRVTRQKNENQFPLFFLFQIEQVNRMTSKLTVEAVKNVCIQWYRGWLSQPKQKKIIESVYISSIQFSADQCVFVKERHNDVRWWDFVWNIMFFSKCWIICWVYVFLWLVYFLLDMFIS